MSWRLLPSSASCLSTTFCVAIPAWSVPGSHSASRPRIRSNRIRTSCSVLLSPWPMWSTEVTLGGGMTMTYGSRSDSGEAVNTPASIQRW